MYFMHYLSEWIMCSYTVLITTPERFWNPGMNLRRKCYQKSPYVIIEQNYVTIYGIVWALALYKHYKMVLFQLVDHLFFGWWNWGIRKKTLKRDTFPICHWYHFNYQFTDLLYCYFVSRIFCWWYVLIQKK